MTAEGHGLLLPFDTDDEQFVRGFELGYLWARLQHEDEVVQTIHATNAEMAIRIGESTGREFTAEELADGWLEVTYAPREETSG